MPWPKTVASHYQTQLGHKDSGRLINGIVVERKTLRRFNWITYLNQQLELL